MNPKTHYILAATLLLSLLLITQHACKKEAENKPPTCEITSPDNGQEIAKGETIVIATDASDSDGSITEVRFFIDNFGKGSATSFPYNYNWNTTNEDLGSHTLKATAIDNNGQSTSNEISVTLVAGGSAPVADFTTDPTSGEAPLTVNFTDQSANNPTSWQWDFGDEGTSTEQNPAHIYNNAGTYTVSFTVTNEYGTDTETKTDYVVVNETDSTPVADFTANPTSGTAPLTVNFTDQSTNNPTSWQWNFGDGRTSTEQNPAHIYNSAGTRTVSLTVTNEYGTDTETKNNYIYVESGEGGQPCPGTPTVTDADGNVYGTVQIGDQCWMKQNLKVGTRINGSINQTNNGTIEKYCYDDNPAYCDTYGGLYQWNEMMQYVYPVGAQGICPDGWHIPTDYEWKRMEMHLGMSPSEADTIGWRGTYEGGKMKSTNGWNNDGNGTNSSGFTALPGGLHSGNGSFAYRGNTGYWWSSSKASDTRSWLRRLYFNYNMVYRDYYDKGLGFSVRCLKN